MHSPLGKALRARCASIQNFQTRKIKLHWLLCLRGPHTLECLHYKFLNPPTVFGASQSRSVSPNWDLCGSQTFLLFQEN